MPQGRPQRSREESSSRRVGLLSTFPPKLCGLATFAAALESELTRGGDEVLAVAIDDGRSAASHVPRVGGELVNGVPASIRSTARLLSTCDVAIVQHEYGIYGGADGDEVVAVLQALTVPAIVILHTVPEQPTENQRTVLEAVCRLASRVVVMTEAAGERLTAGYAVDAADLVVIPHGASVSGSLEPHEAWGAGGGAQTRLLTWGLLGPGKGIEHVIRALALLQDIRPRVRYTVAGATHPNVFARDGDEYRDSLIRDAWATGVAGSVTFDETYRGVADLGQLVAAASLVVLPYDSRDQVTSGVLVDAIAAGRPVIATAFPHAVELLSDGAGLVVPQRDPVALAAAIRSVVSEPGVLQAMAARAREIAPSLSWAAVADQYRDLCDDLSSDDVAVAL